MIERENPLARLRVRDRSTQMTSSVTA